MLLSLSEYKEEIKGINGHLGDEEGYLLYQLATQIKNKYILEIGALQGLSTVSLALSGKHILSVDLWNDANVAGYTCNIEIHKQNLDNRGLKNYTQYRMSSDEATKIISETDIGLIFIDADHSYKGVKTDIENWIERLNKGGWLIFHDYCNSIGVKRAIDEWLLANLKNINKMVGVGSLVGFHLI